MTQLDQSWCFLSLSWQAHFIFWVELSWLIMCKNPSIMSLSSNHWRTVLLIERAKGVQKSTRIENSLGSQMMWMVQTNVDTQLKLNFPNCSLLLLNAWWKMSLLGLYGKIRTFLCEIQHPEYTSAHVSPCSIDC